MMDALRLAGGGETGIILEPTSSSQRGAHLQRHTTSY